MHRLRMILPLMLVYLALTANFEGLNIIMGFLVATAVTFLLPQVGYPLPLQTIPTTLWALLRYIVILAVDLIVSGVQVARIVLSPQMPIQPGIIAIPSQSKSVTGVALSAHAITLTPGELVVEIDETGVMYTHCLDASQAEIAISQAQTKRRELLEKMIL